MGDDTIATDHVYSDLARVLGHVGDDAIVVLHDCFAPGESVDTGPWQAVRRLQRQAVRITAWRVGKLPWLAQAKTHRTGLVLLGRA